jgi:thiamine-phosphate pyrophosphorylase
MVTSEVGIAALNPAEQRQQRGIALRGLYAITDSCLTPGPMLLEAVAAALRGGAVLVQYRDKSRDHARRRAEAAALVALCRQQGVAMIVNDDAELALAVGADGVHVGADDATLESVRQQLGPAAIIGVSCYDQLQKARWSAAHGADYVAFGSFFASPTKPAAVPAHFSILAAARRELSLPIAAIGGIDQHNGARLVDLGADLLAVVSGVFGAPDVEAAAAGLSRLFATRSSSVDH